VNRDSDILGHAEINALKDAVEQLDLVEIINNNDIKLISTLEPCEMCKGVLINYGINNILFLKEKSLGLNLKNSYREFSYQIKKTKILSEDLLTKLNELHPHYKN